jgi:hypothetical protein
VYDVRPLSSEPKGKGRCQRHGQDTAELPDEYLGAMAGVSLFRAPTPGAHNDVAVDLGHEPPNRVDMSLDATYDRRKDVLIDV